MLRWIAIALLTLEHAAALAVPRRLALLGAGSLCAPGAAHASAAGQAAAIAKAQARRAKEADVPGQLREAQMQLRAFDKDLDAQFWDNLRDALHRPPLGSHRALLSRLAADDPPRVGGRAATITRALFELEDYVYFQQREAHKDLGHACAWCPKIYVEEEKMRELHALVATADAEIGAIVGSA